MVSSPRSWRCFLQFYRHGSTANVFSTLVEVFLRKYELKKAELSLLHARGGVSFGTPKMRGLTESSPRSWRCFYRRGLPLLNGRVFSTLVEVFLYTNATGRPIMGLLHARGGVSLDILVDSMIEKSSPRSWRCFPTLS